MGQGIITANHGEGLYDITIKLEQSRATNRIAAIDARLLQIPLQKNTLNLQLINATNTCSEKQAELQAIAAEFFATPPTKTRDDIEKAAKERAVAENDLLEVQRKLANIKLEESSITKEREALVLSMSTYTRANVWCADYTTELAVGATVGTIEIKGDVNSINITPGGDAAKALGILQHSASGTPSGVFYNAAIFPCWQKWKPTYRVGTILEIDYENDTCDLYIEPTYSRYQGLMVDQPGDETIEVIVSGFGGWAQFCRDYPNHPLATNTTSINLPATAQLMTDLSAINREVNSAYNYKKDTETYGQLEHWDFMSYGGSGDCEDFALTKAQKLLDKGYPASGMHIETGITAGGIGHAWLVVHTDHGYYGLDINFNNVMDNELLPYSDRKKNVASDWKAICQQLNGVPIDYMSTLNSSVFIISDRVVVEFTGQDWTQPKVIGFETNPRYEPPRAGCYSGQMNYLHMTETGNLISVTFFGDETRVRAMQGIQSCGVSETLSWACTGDGKLYIWGGDWSFIDDGIQYIQRNRAIKHFKGRYTWWAEPFHILTQYKIKEAHFVCACSDKNDVVSYPAYGVVDRAVCLAFVTMSGDLYTYSCNDTISGWPAATKVGDWYIYEPTTQVKFIASNVKTARISATGYILGTHNSIGYPEITGAIIDMPPSVIWLTTQKELWGQGINACGELGSNSLAGACYWGPPEFDHAPTWEEYYTNQGYTGLSVPPQPTDLYVAGPGGVSDITATGRGLFYYYDTMYIPLQLWNDPILTCAIKAGSSYLGAHRICLQKFTDFTTSLCLPISQYANYINQSLLPAYSGSGSSLVILLGTDKKLYVLGRDTIGNLRGYLTETCIADDPRNEFKYTETPINIFTDKTFNYINKSNYRQIFHNRDDPSGGTVLSAARTLDGKTYTWGSGQYYHDYYPVPHLQQLPQTQYDKLGNLKPAPVIKFYSSGTREPESNYSIVIEYDELFCVDYDGNAWRAKHYLFTEPAWELYFNVITAFNYYIGQTIPPEAPDDCPQ